MRNCSSRGKTIPKLENPKDLIGSLKPSLHLIPPSFEILVAEVLKHGAKKYGSYNWRRKRISVCEYISACRRHLAAHLDGEDLDPESGLPHLGHASATLAVLIDALSLGNVIDDRPMPGAVPSLLKSFSGKNQKAPDYLLTTASNMRKRTLKNTNKTGAPMKS